MKWLSAAIVALAVSVALWASVYPPRGTVATYRLARIERGRLAMTVSAKGGLSAMFTVQVGSQVSGQIKELYADFNSPVRKGQLIARIDPEIFEARVNEARAGLDAARGAVLDHEAQVHRARANVEKARAAWTEGQAQTTKAQVAVSHGRLTLDRALALYGQNLIARSEVESAQVAHDGTVALLDAARSKARALSAATDSAAAQLEVAEASLASARAQVVHRQAALDVTLVDLEHTAIRAPVDGIVIWRAVDVGQTVSARLEAPRLFTIAPDLTTMQAETFVDEADIARVEIGQRATFTVDAFPGQTFAGTVVQIRKAPQRVENVVTYTVIVAVDNQHGLFVPDMTATVGIVIAEKADVLKVSNEALRLRMPPATAAPHAAVATPRGDAQRERWPGRVWTLGSDGKPRPVPVMLGITDGAATEILDSDLEEGQVVIIGTGRSRGTTTP